VVQESQSSSKVLGSLNKIFIALIPKKTESISFEDFLPISYCNLIYNLISKIIANKLKPILSGIILEERFVFLFKRQFHDAVSLAKEASHSIKALKIPSIVLNLDLLKAHDKVNWTFLRLGLIQLGMDLDLVTRSWGALSMLPLLF
jgi:hypothetical protein